MKAGLRQGPPQTLVGLFDVSQRKTQISYEAVQDCGFVASVFAGLPRLRDAVRVAASLHGQRLKNLQLFSFSLPSAELDHMIGIPIHSSRVQYEVFLPSGVEKMSVLKRI